MANQWDMHEAERGSAVTNDKKQVNNDSLEKAFGDEVAEEGECEERASDGQDPMASNAEKVKATRLQMALQQYDDEKIRDYFDPPEDDPMPMVISEEGRAAMLETFSKCFGPKAAARIVDKEVAMSRQRLEQWKIRRRKKRIRNACKWGGIAAAVALVVFIGSRTLDVSAFRLPDILFRPVVKGNYTEITVDETIADTEAETLDSIRQEYVLGKTIEGFYLEDQIIINKLIKFTYKNNEAQCYTFSQQVAEDLMMVNTEEYEVEIVDTMYGQASYFSYDDVNSISWMYQGYFFRIEGNLTKNQLLELQESLEKRKNIDESN